MKLCQITGVYSIFKKNSTRTISYEKNYNDKFFDFYHVRQQSYGETRSTILNKLSNKKSVYKDTLHNIKGDDIVKKYKKKKRKNKYRKF